MPTERHTWGRNNRWKVHAATVYQVERPAADYEGWEPVWPCTTLEQAEGWVVWMASCGIPCRIREE